MLPSYIFLTNIKLHNIFSNVNKFSELDMFADDEDIALAEAAASKNRVDDDSNHQLMRASENPNLTDNWDDAEG